MSNSWHGVQWNNQAGTGFLGLRHEGTGRAGMSLGPSSKSTLVFKVNELHSWLS